MTTQPHVWVRAQTAEKAIASARRLSAKYGQGRFAVIADPAGGTFAPYAIVSHPSHSLNAR